MKRTVSFGLFSVLVGVLTGVVLSAGIAQIPTRLFDVRNGNDLTLSGTTYPNATVVLYKDTAAKNEVLDAFASARGWTATVPDPANPGQTIANPQSKQQAFNAALTQFIRETVRATQGEAAATTARKTATDAADAKLPPQ